MTTPHTAGRRDGREHDHANTARCPPQSACPSCGCSRASWPRRRVQRWQGTSARGQGPAACSSSSLVPLPTNRLQGVVPSLKKVAPSTHSNGSEEKREKMEETRQGPTERGGLRRYVWCMGATGYGLQKGGQPIASSGIRQRHGQEHW